jgi:hypothetical protein
MPGGGVCSSYTVQFLSTCLADFKPIAASAFPQPIVAIEKVMTTLVHWCQMAEFRAAGPKNGPVKFLAA